MQKFQHCVFCTNILVKQEIAIRNCKWWEILEFNPSNYETSSKNAKSSSMQHTIITLTHLTHTHTHTHTHQCPYSETYLAQAFSTRALQNSFLLREQLKSKRPLRTGSRSSTTTSTHSPYCQNQTRGGGGTQKQDRHRDNKRDTNRQAGDDGEGMRQCVA